MHSSYVSKLNKEQIFQSQNMTHEIWGGESQLQERMKALDTQLNFANGTLLSMSGLVNDKQELICSLKKYSLLLKYKNKVLATIGLGAIYTDPSYRGKGLASKLIQEVLKEAQGLGFSAAVLFTDIDPNFYKSFGFIELKAQNWIISLKEIDFNSGTLKYRLAKEQDISQLIKYYNHIFPSDYGHPARDENIWNFFRQLYATNAIHTKDYILTHESKDIGYISISYEDGQLFLNEFYVPDDFEEMFANTLKELATNHNVDKIYGCRTFQNLEAVPKTYKKRDAEIPMLKSLRSDIQFDQNFWFGFLDQF